MMDSAILEFPNALEGVLVGPETQNLLFVDEMLGTKNPKNFKSRWS